MIRKWIIVVFVFLLTFSGYSFCAIAGCKSDCQNDYESEIESCKDQHDDPSDADSLQTCTDDAKREYQSCIDECED